jgi:Ca2+-binding RTX toxin-like protein
MGQAPLSGNNSIDGLLWDGWHWDTNIVNYSFPATAAAYPTASTGFEALSALQRDAARAGFDQVNAFTNLQLVENAGPSEIHLAQATVVDTNNDGTPDNNIGTASGRAPSADHVNAGIAGDIWYNPSGYDNPLAGTYQFASGIIHEIGHALGLKHPQDTIGGAPVLDGSIDGLAYTVMAYRDYPGDAIDNIGSTDCPQSFMLYDIQALQYLYGADFFSSNGDNVYKWTPTIKAGKGTNFFVDGNEYEPNVDLANNIVFRTVWDGGGFDTYDFSLYSTDLNVNLNPGAWTSLGTQLASLEDGMSPPGNIANAFLYQGNPASLIEAVICGSGDDTVIGNDAWNVLDGGAGADYLYGGLGVDTATYIRSSVGVTASLRETRSDHDRFSSIEVLVGSNHDDTLTGDAGANTLYGMNGGDALEGGGGLDHIYGGDGDDILSGGRFDDVDELYGELGDDTYRIAELNSDNLHENANEGTDTVVSSVTWSLAGNVNIENLTLTGAAVANGYGNDLANIIIGNAANNLIFGHGGNDTLYGGAGNDGLAGHDGHDRLYGGAGNDTYYLDGDDPVPNGVDYDTIVEAAGSGYDTAYVTTDSVGHYDMADNLEYAVIVDEGQFDLNGNDIDNRLDGNADQNYLSGYAGNDDLYGLGGEDRLFGGDGADLLIGGDGHDRLYGGAGSDVYHLDGNDPVPNGVDYDTIVEAADGGYDIAFVLTDSLGYYTLADNLEEADIADEGQFYLYGNAIDNLLVGNDDINGLYGHAGDDALYGRGGEDTLSGDGGADTLDGGASHDRLYGGAGNDIYYLYDLTLIDDVSGWEYDAVNEAVGEGTDTVFVASLGNARYYVDANIENVQVTGTGNLDVIGNDLDNSLVGNAGGNLFYGQGGNDTLNGGAGIDTLYGGGGDDTFVVDSNGDMVRENTGEGYDRVLASASFGLYATAEIELLRTADDAGTAAIALSGNDFAQTIVGNAGANFITGDGGDDTLNGGAGADTLYGGAGNDTYVVDNAGDIVNENIAGSSGFDRVNSSVSINMVDGAHFRGDIEMGVLLGTANLSVRGNALNNLLYGNSGNNVVNGAGGADIMRGRGGNDIYYVNNAADIVDESIAGSNGFDRVQAAVSINLSDGGHFRGAVEMGVLVGAANLNIAGNALNNVLYGNSGNNIVNGAGGNDVMRGMAGNDTYIVANAGDVVDEGIAGSNGFDRVNSAVSFNLSAGAHFRGAIEMGVLLGSANLNLAGNGLNNLLYGNAGNNVISGAGGNDIMRGMAGNDRLFGGAGNDTLNGGAGADQMYGGSGNDTYVVNSAGDIVDESIAGSNGFDRVNSAVSINMADGVHFMGGIEMGVLLGAANLNVTGNALNNLLVGNSGNNVVNGAGGNDNMRGMAGNDIYIVANAGDIVDESVAGSSGFDRVQSALTINLWDVNDVRGTVEMAVLTGGGNVNASGNAVNNLIVGNAGNNVLNGGFGNDILRGLGGADTFFFSTALNAIHNVDTIDDFSVPADTIRLENGVFTGLAAGVLAANAFHLGAAAADASDRIVYNSTTGALSFDADGVGGTAAIQFAHLTAGLGLTNADFVVV